MRPTLSVRFEIADQSDTNIDSFKRDDEESSRFKDDEEAAVVVPRVPSASRLARRPSLVHAMTRPLQNRHRLEFLVIMIGAALLAFNAGFVNGSTILLGNYPTAHITGTVSRAGIDMAEGDFHEAYVYFVLILCFIVGATISGVMLKGDKFKLGMAYGPVFLLGSVLFLAACLTAVYAYETKLYFYFAAMACGLQNSMTTTYSGNIIRTTHMTGTATDIGLAFGKIILGDYSDSWKLMVLIPLLLAYFVGGVVSVYAHRRLAHLTLVINVIVFFVIGMVYCIVVGQKLNIPLWKAMFGFYTVLEERVARGKKRAKSFVRRVGVRVGKILTSSEKKRAQEEGSSNNDENNDNEEEGDETRGEEGEIDEYQLPVVSDNKTLDVV